MKDSGMSPPPPCTVGLPLYFCFFMKEDTGQIHANVRCPAQYWPTVLAVSHRIKVSAISTVLSTPSIRSSVS